MRVKVLEDMAFFLNGVTPDMTADKWETFCKAAKKRRLFGDIFLSRPFTEKVTLAEAQGLRAEIVRDLLYREKDPEGPMASLLGSLNRLEMKTVYQCLPLDTYGKPRPGERILKAGKNRFVPVFGPDAKTTKELLYVTLGQALKDGTLDRLITCLHCRKWMAGRKTGRKFCSDTCKDTFHYNKRIKSGYFADFQRGARKAAKEAQEKVQLKRPVSAPTETPA